MQKFIINLSIFLCFLLSSFPAFGAGNVRIYSKRGVQFADVALGLTGNVLGLAHDGFFFWAVDSTTVYQLYQTQAGTFTITQSFNPISQISGAASISAIETDGTNLFIAWVGTVTTIRGVAVFTKNNIFLYLMTALDINSAIGSDWQDLTWDGNLLWAVRDSGLANPNQQDLRVAIPDQNILIYATNFRAQLRFFAWDGKYLWGGVSGSNNVAVYQHAIPFLAVSQITNWAITSTMNAATFPRAIDEDGNISFSGDRIYIAYN